MTKFSKLLSYYFAQLKFSILFWIFEIGFLVVPPLTILLCYYLNSDVLYYSSFIIGIVFQIYTFLFILFLNVKLYNANKYNLSDLKLLGNNYQRTNLFFSKFTLILIVSLFGLVFMSLSSLATLMVWKINRNIILGIIVSNLIGLALNVLLITPILIIINIFLSKSAAPILGLLTIAIFPANSIVNNYVLTDTHKNNDLNININNQNTLISYNKIYELDNYNNVVNQKYVYTINSPYDVSTQKDTLNQNNNLHNNINYINNWNWALLLGNIATSVQQSIFANFLKNDAPYLLNKANLYQSSLTKLTPRNFIDCSQYFDSQNEFVLTNAIDDLNMFALTTNELTDLIIHEIDVIYQDEKLKKIIDNPDGLKPLIEKVSQKYWDFDFLKQSVDQKNLIFRLLGSEQGPLFYIWYYNQNFINRIGSMFNIIQNKYNQDFANLLKTLWFSNTSIPYLNLILMNNQKNEIVNELGNIIKQKYPALPVPNSANYAANVDVNFFAKSLVLIENKDSIKLLTIHKNSETNNVDEIKYEPVNVQEFNKIVLNIVDPNKYISSQQEWIDFLYQTKQQSNSNIQPSSNIHKEPIDSNSLPNLKPNKPPKQSVLVARLTEIQNNLQTLNSNLVKINLANANFSLNTFNQGFEIVVTPMISGAYLFIVAQCLLTITFFLIAWYSFKKVKLD